MEDELKTVIYRGGLVSFCIPADWIEEYEPSGGGAFYEDTADSGTLRLNVLTFEAPESAKNLDAAEMLEPLARKAGVPLTKLPSGNALISYGKSAAESSESLFITYWEVANVVQPKHVRLAVFSFTLLESQVKETVFEDQLQFLDREISKCRFAPILGVVEHG